MRQAFGTALGLALGTLLYDAIGGRFDGGSLYRAVVAFALSFVLLALLATFQRARRSR
jgi:drug/metabolite transporter (DMT)-like permease